MNSATHVYIRPQNINNKSMSETELDPISPQISTLALIFLCFFLSCYPHFHLVSFLSCFFFSIPCFLLLFFLLPFFLLLFFRGKIVTFFLFLYLHPDCYLFFPVTFFPVTFFPTQNCYFFSCYLFSCYFFSGAKLLLFFLFLYIHPDCYLFFLLLFFLLLFSYPKLLLFFLCPFFLLLSFRAPGRIPCSPLVDRGQRD